MALAETAKLAVDLSLGGNFETRLSSASRGLSSFSSTVSRTASKIGSDIGGGLQKAAHNIERLAVAAAGLAVGGGAAAVKWAGDFQAGMQTINTVAFESAAGLQRAGDALRETFRSTGQSMADLQGAEYDLVSAGVKLSDAQAGVNTAVRLGIGALGSTAEAVDVLTTAINSYNLKAKDGSIATSTWTRLSDELAQAVADGKVKLSEIASTYADVAPVAAQFGVKTGEIAAALGYLTAKGNPASETLTQMNRAIIELAKPKGDMQKVLKDLGQTGPELIAKNGLAGALQIIRDRADKLKIPFIDLFGRVEAYKFALQTTGTNQAGFAAELDKIAHSAGMTSKQFDERAQGFNYQLGVLKANVQDAGITIGTALLPQLTDLAKEAAGFLQGHQQDIADFAKGLAGGFRDAVTWARRLDWGGILDAVKGVAGFGKSLAEGFMAMPTEVKAILLGLFGANKLTGGAVVKVAVDLAGGFAGGLANAMGQGLLKAGIGKAFIQPVFVTNEGFGGIGGLGGLGGAAAGAGEVGAIGGLGVLGTAALATVAGVASVAALNELGKYNQSQEGANINVNALAGAAQGGVVGFGNVYGRPATRDTDAHAVDNGLTNIYRATRDLGYEVDNAQAKSWAQMQAAADRIVRPLDTLHRDFMEQIGVLKRSQDPHKIAAAASAAAKDVTKGVGSLGSTRDLLATLQKDRSIVARSGDRGELAKIDAAIRAVQGKIPGREWVQRQLAEAERIAKSSESQDRKAADLKRIQSQLLSHGDRTAASEVAKLTQIANKKSTINVPVSVSVTNNVSSRDIYVSQLVRARGIHQSGQSAYP